MTIFKNYLVDGLYSIHLDFVGPYASHMWKKLSCKKTCQSIYRNLFTHFLEFWFLPKY
jgi:hypothetical protein